MGLTIQWAEVSVKRSRRELLGVVVLLALLGGVSLVAVAGARRTQSAYPRFLRASDASTMAVDPGPYDPATDKAIASFPEVVRSTAYVAFTVGPLKNGKPDFLQDFETIGTLDGRFFTMDRFAATSGRLPDPQRVTEIAVNETTAKLYHYRVGQHLDLGLYSDEQTSQESFFDDPPPPLIRTDATIVGIGLFPDEVVQDDTNRTPLALVTPAYSQRARKYTGYAWQGLILRRGDADVEAVKARYMSKVPTGTPQFFRTTSVDTFHAEQAVQPLSLALASFGLIAGAAALVLVGQALSRLQRHAQGEQDVLRAFGASPRSLVATAVFGPLLAIAAGTFAAMVVAFLASPLMPLGAPRRVEVEPGLNADWTVLALGALLLLVPLAVAALVIAVRQLPHRRSADRSVPYRSRVVTAAGRAGMPPHLIAGLRMAFEPGDGSTAVPVRSVMVAGTVAVVTLVASLSFGASYTHLLDTPRLYGWNWDAAVYDQSGYGNINLARTHQELDGKPGIAAWSAGYFGADSIDGVNLPLLGMEPGSTVTPPLESGRMIRNGNEVVLGAATAEQLGKALGDTVRIGVATKLATLRVVGLATLPSIGISHGAHTSLGVGALVVPDRVPGFNRQVAGEGPGGTPPAPAGPPVVFIRFATDANPSRTRAWVARATGRIGQYPGSAVLLDPQRPAEIVNSSDVGGVPALLACALGLSAALSLALALGASVRRRRHELALLRALGFTRRQLAASVAWQATATIGVALLVGVPVGLAVGRVLWTAFARKLDVVPHASIPVVQLGLVAAAALIVANLAAALPARRASSVRPAMALHAE